MNQIDHIAQLSDVDEKRQTEKSGEISVFVQGEQQKQQSAPERALERFAPSNIIRGQIRVKYCKEISGAENGSDQEHNAADIRRELSRKALDVRKDPRFLHVAESHAHQKNSKSKALFFTVSHQIEDIYPKVFLRKICGDKKTGREQKIGGIFSFSSAKRGEA